MFHLTKTSSCYIDNMWGWTADHSHERGGFQNIATGRGALIEATRGTWLTGASFEHNTLYNYKPAKCSRCFCKECSKLRQTIGKGQAQQNDPNPWPVPARYGDPDFSWCSKTDQSCRMGLALNLYLYAAAFWTFFHGEVSACYNCAATTCGPN